MAVGMILVLLLVAVVSLLLARRMARPLEKIISAAEKFAEGDLEREVRVRGATEVNAVAQALNEMAAQLRNKIGMLQRRNGEQRAVLASMKEGVIAVDASGNVLTMNKAAGKLLGVEPQEARGRSIEEAVRDTRIQSFISKTNNAAAGHPIEQGLALGGRKGSVCSGAGNIAS